MFPYDEDVPWILKLNPLLAVVGWQVWWEYEYVAGVLVKSETQWRRNDTNSKE